MQIDVEALEGHFGFGDKYRTSGGTTSKDKWKDN